MGGRLFPVFPIVAVFVLVVVFSWFASGSSLGVAVGSRLCRTVL